MIVVEGTKLLTIEEVAERIGRHPETVRVWCRNGTWGFPAIKAGRFWRVRESDFEEWLKGGRNVMDGQSHDEDGKYRVYVVSTGIDKGGLWEFAVRAMDEAMTIVAEGECYASEAEAREEATMAIKEIEG